jgi:hypothetical protein
MYTKITSLFALFFLGIVLNLKAQNVPAYVPTTGLVAWWGLNGTANDASGNAYNGTINGATSTSDRNGNTNSAYDFNGTSAYIALPTGIASGFTAGKLTVAGWFYVTTNSAWASLIKNWGSVSTGAFHVGLNDLSQKLHAQITQSNNTTAFILAPSVMTLNAWHHVALTADGSFLHLYQDGVEITSPVSYNGTLKTNFLYTNIGAKPSTTNMPANFAGYLNGKTDDIGIWNVALTQQQITGLFTSTPTGISNTENEIQFSTYPNPTSSIITVDTRNSKFLGPVKVFNNLGELVITDSPISSIFEISLDNLPDGVYYLELNLNGRIQHEKVLKK